MRDLFETEHEDFRRSVRTFMEKEVEPNNDGARAATSESFSLIAPRS